MKYLALVPIAVALSACSLVQKEKYVSYTKIEVPAELNEKSVCDKEVDPIKGTTGRDLMRFVDRALNKIEICRVEKAALIDLINKANKVNGHD